ncbi:MAG TPA: redoxin family protein [Candidatus Acidoferrales bacterium]|jgi:thiol-disulfide isomerase/thioredoxin/predicted negative regulator of RcsB-dependent stress response|nr:redoxin family protein [Candidatus Acidoferrales bacterium]
MRYPTRLLLCFLAFSLAGVARAQQSSPSAPPAKTPAKKSSPSTPSAPKPKADSAPAEPPDSPPDQDAELQILVRQAGNDPAVLVKNLESYLSRYPDSPRRGAIYRALTESEMSLHNQQAALDYAEKVIAIQPEDSQSVYLAVTLLEKMPGDANQLKAIDYDTRLIDRVSKADPDSRPQQMTLEDWQTGRNKFLVDLYVLRGRVQHHLHKNDDAVKDLSTGFRMMPNAEAALTLGEIAEEEKHSDEAIREYATAFMLAGQEQADPSSPAMDREMLRLRMGNLWHYSHPSSAGLGDILLSAYDRSHEALKADKADAPVYNKDVNDPLQFSLRHVDGSGPVKLSESHGKVVVLNFWTTWCVYCNAMETMLADVRAKIAGRDDVVFVAVNSDDDESLVASYLLQQKLGGTAVFADGVNQALHVESIPTVLVLDKSGKIAYRTQGFAPDGFTDLVIAAITKAATAAP